MYLASKFEATMATAFTLLSIDPKKGTPSTSLGPKMGMESTSLSKGSDRKHFRKPWKAASIRNTQKMKRQKL